ncbi:hypothetical protein GKE82_24480 [Conexibacter sp. W3-3-2]|uniref:hypothetical protein n=1 Tax=Conexibacter sp. W3-3-2 TaxID=2675227 RepID=UPI0012B8045E|nr:hypothetical protein [Conexibacter sp. W3-3-2]MTD47367.1 hypothetical protein [Conexibacter sp. W3-3-2]
MAGPTQYEAGRRYVGGPQRLLPMLRDLARADEHCNVIVEIDTARRRAIGYLPPGLEDADTIELLFHPWTRVSVAHTPACELIAFRPLAFVADERLPMVGAFTEEADVLAVLRRRLIEDVRRFCGDQVAANVLEGRDPRGVTVAPPAVHHRFTPGGN